MKTHFLNNYNDFVNWVINSPFEYLNTLIDIHTTKDITILTDWMAEFMSYTKKEYPYYLNLDEVTHFKKDFPTYVQPFLIPTSSLIELLWGDYDESLKQRLKKSDLYTFAPIHVINVYTWSYPYATEFWDKAIENQNTFLAYFPPIPKNLSLYKLYIIT